MNNNSNKIRDGITLDNEKLMRMKLYILTAEKKNIKESSKGDSVMINDLYTLIVSEAKRGY